MKHVFIINPTAGKKDCTAALMAMSKALAARHGLEAECILTKRPGHAAETARTLAQSGRAVRIYACGGDGTVNEVANGIAGSETAAMTCIPVGTGNDFFLDAIDCNGRLALTVACSGFDAQVAEDVHTYGSLPLLGGQGSYILSLAVNFIARGLGHDWTITLDGLPMPGEYVLAAVCNGRYYGGGFMPVAEARMDDGVLHTLVVKKVSRPTFLRFVGAYAKGEYYRLPQCAACYTAKEIVIDSPERDLVTCLDGEIVRGRRAVLRLSEKKVHFFGPAGCSPNATSRPLPI